ncbi:hypothetical protein CALCODRAFT_503419 [Calocera cornea HHB12733]|uniref:Uncharacterized protein n=1 Tax=Calocera cornea HHB12733 TaxID=1353952 RepID=A0A165CW05_9BASI|nr:hypothetical protein CALCODRAFT_503419 [Calocera cornea HHB12733]
MSPHLTRGSSLRVTSPLVLVDHTRASTHTRLLSPHSLTLSLLTPLYALDRPTPTPPTPIPQHPNTLPPTGHSIQHS